jgi:hypothetical protein
MFSRFPGGPGAVAPRSPCYGAEPALPGRGTSATWPVTIALTLGLALGVCWMFETSARAAPADKCGPSARLSGDPGLIASLRGLLEARGIATSDDQRAACLPVAVEVRAARPGYDLTISDAEGRMARKTIDRQETAAMVIESWARADLGALLPARSQSSWHAPGIRAAMSISREPSLVAPAASAAAPTAVHLRVLGESAVHRNQSLWMGASAGACLRLGWSCLGSQVRFSQAMRALDTRAAAAPARSLDALLAAQVPLRLGRVWLAPEIAVGGGRLDRTLTVPHFLPMVGLNGGGGATSGGRGDGGRQGYRGDSPRSEGDQRGDEGDNRAAELVTSAAPAPGSSYQSTQYGLRASGGLTVMMPVVGGMSLAFTMAVGLPGNARAGLGLAYGRASSPGTALPSGTGH